MEKLLTSKNLLNGLINNVLVILTLVIGEQLLSLTDNKDDGADIGGGLIILFLPTITCIIIGILRGKKSSKNTKEIWIGTPNYHNYHRTYLHDYCKFLSQGK